MFQIFKHRRPRMANAPTILPTRRFGLPGSKKNDTSPSLLARLNGLVVNRRYLRVTFAALLCFSLTFLFWPSQSIEELKLWAFPVVMPPLYERYHHFERNLPQLDLSLPAPDGKHAKYFWARNHVHGTRTCLALLVCVWVAASEWSDSVWLGQCDAGTFTEFTPGVQVGSRVRRLRNGYLASDNPLHHSFVFPNYVWEHTGLNYTTFNNKTIPNHIPMTAMIIGILHTISLPIKCTPQHCLMLLRQDRPLAARGHQE
jgi:hypothetical protein